MKREENMKKIFYAIIAASALTAFAFGAGAAENGDASGDAKKAEESKLKDKKPLGDFLDVKLTFTFSDDNVMHNDSFTPSIDINTGRHDFDNAVNIADTHLVVYKNLEGFLTGVFTEAALVLRFAYVEDGKYALKDDGSFLGLRYKFNDSSKNYVEINGFPINAQRFLMGYSFELTWGGSASWPQNLAPVPGARLLGKFSPVEILDAYLFAGIKTRQQTNRDELDSSTGASTGSAKTVYAGLFGGGAAVALDGQSDEPIMLSLDICGGFIQKGDNPQINEMDLKNVGLESSKDDILATGVSLNAAAAIGDPIGDPIDLKLYRRDPRNLFVDPTAKAKEKGIYALSLSFDMTYMRENLRKYTDAPGSDSIADSPAGTYDGPNGTLAANLYGVTANDRRIATSNFDALGFAVNWKARLTIGDVRMRYMGAYIYRNLQFLLFDGPHGDPPFYAFPENKYLDDPSTSFKDAEITLKGEHRIRNSIDVKFNSIHLTLGTTSEILMPATKTLTLRASDGQGGYETHKYVTVYKDKETSASTQYLTRQIRAVLPVDFSGKTIYEQKFMARYEFSELLWAQFEVGYMRDLNMFKYATSGMNLKKVYEDDDVTNPVSVAIMLQAKF